jgi:signal transduction histidine kinase
MKGLAMASFLRWLASCRLRIVFRLAFLLLAFSVLALATAVLQEEKARAWRNYEGNLRHAKENIAARLRHPSGQLALLNADRPPDWPAKRLSPLLLPFSAIDFDDLDKSRHVVEMTDCSLTWPDGARLCVALGNNPWMGGFVYAIGDFPGPPLVAHPFGEKHFIGATRAVVRLQWRGQSHEWVAPFEIPPAWKRQDKPPKEAPDADAKAPALAPPENVRGRFTGYLARADDDYRLQRQDKEFRGWAWQEAGCQPSLPKAQGCLHRTAFSLRLPLPSLLSGLLADRKSPWPPKGWRDIRLSLQILPPDSAKPIFDSATPGAQAPFGLADLDEFLRPGETLVLKAADGTAVARLHGEASPQEPASPWLSRLIEALPASGKALPPTIHLAEKVPSPAGTFTLALEGQAEQAATQTLGAAATRLAWFVGAILLAILLAWAAIEWGLILRIARLTRRASQLSDPHAHADKPDYADLEGSDEMGILAAELDRLLRRVREDARQETIRAEKEKAQWHAVGHEIMSPLQSLFALHADEGDPNRRYLLRMRQAIRTLYGEASPSEAFSGAEIAQSCLDLDAFLQNIAENAPHVGIAGVDYAPIGPTWACADEYPLEDALGHLLNNANRLREPGTPITMRLCADAEAATLHIHNTGPAIAPADLPRIFEYGFSTAKAKGDGSHRGQGLFVAKAYLAKMGGTIRAENENGGVGFWITLKMAGQSPA